MNHIEATIWSMKEGNITELKFDGMVWIPKNNNCKGSGKGNVKKNYFIRFLNNKKLGDIFRLDEFYKQYPKHKTDAKYHKRLEKTISDLIQDGSISMWVNPDEFKVMK